MSPQPERRESRSITARYRRLRDRTKPVWAPIRTRVEIDTRALAALRIALGLIVLIDLLHRSGDIELFYTDAGIYPVAVYEVTYTRYTGLSIHAASGELWFQQVLFVLAGVAALSLVLGYRTRLVTFVTLVLLFSLHARNPAVLNGADRLLRVLLLIALLSPLGERWSVDALRRGAARTSVASFGTAALLVQPIVVFGSNAILKHRGETWYSGEGVRTALANDVMTVHLGNHLLDYPLLLEALNWIWVVLLAGSVVFLLLTTGRLRALFALVYIGAFAGMVVTMALGLFPLVLIASVLAFLTTPFWDAIARRAPTDTIDRDTLMVKIGPLGRPPVERRVLGALSERGYGRLGSSVVRVARVALTAAGFLVLVWILVFSASHVAGTDVPEAIDNDHLHEQHWGLYSPDPASAYSWFVVGAELDDGTTVDGFEGGELNRDRPPDASQEYDTFRHRKFMGTVRESGEEDTTDIVAESYADWACERANERYGDRVERVTVVQLVQPSPLEEHEDVRERTVIERPC